MEFKSSNPVFGARFYAEHAKENDAMSLQGTINKTYILFGLLLATGIPTYMMSSTEAGLRSYGPMILPSIGIASLVAFVVALIGIFANKKHMSIIAPIYAILQGVVLGGISGIFNFVYEGIVFQAIVLTLGVFFGMLGIYKTGIIQPTEKFKTGMAAGFMALLIFILIKGVFGLVTGTAMFAWASPMSIGISILIIGFAALSLILDFDEIETGVERGAPKYMEWYGAFGLMITIIWIYMEILKLLSKLRER
jgi:uncharacterized YccA/Bax inhibitor family protein